MAGITRTDSFSQQFVDLKDEVRRLRRASAASQNDIWEYDTFTITGAGAGDTTHILSFIPKGINVALLNGVGLVEGVDYTCDYTTGVVTVTATLTAGDVLHVRYVTTGELKVYSTPADTGPLASYYTNFDGPTSSTLPPPWIDVVAGWGVSFAATWAHSAAPAIAVIETNTPDGTVAVTTGSFPQHGIAFRVGDANNYWRVGRGGASGDGVYKVVAGVETFIGGLTLGSGFAISVVMSGSSVTVNVNVTAQTVATTDSFNATATRHGLWANSSGGNIQDFTWTT